MRILPLLLILPVFVLAQTEFYISTYRAPYYNSCLASKNSLPIVRAITSDIKIYGIFWNPDSLSWCTKEGYRASVLSFDTIWWKIDNESIGGGSEFQTYIFDTLEHTVTATCHGFPDASLRYKADKKLPFLACSINKQIFESDSIHMFIESTYPAIFNDSLPIPVIQDDSNSAYKDSVIRYSSTYDNSAIMTFNQPSDTSIKLTSFRYHSRCKATFSPSLNSYSILFPLAVTLVLAKSRIMLPGSQTELDTILAIFTKLTVFDTVKIIITTDFYTDCPTCPPMRINKFKPIQKDNLLSSKSGIKMYDVRGRLINRFSAVPTNFNSHKLSNGIYLLQGKNGKPIVVRPGIVTK